MRAADYIVDVGPGAGVHGGEDRGCRHAGGHHGTRPIASPASISPASGRIAVPAERRAGNGQVPAVLRLHARTTCSNVDVSIPLGHVDVRDGRIRLGQIQSFVNEIIATSSRPRLNRARVRPGKHDRYRRAWRISTRSIVIDQSPIGRTPRSNPATYTGLFDDIRDLFAATR